MTGPSPTEPTLLQRVAAGDPAAMKLCIEHYGPLIWAVSRDLFRNATQAEDAVQEAFIQLWKNAGRYDPDRASERTFVATIARRKLIDWRRKLGRRPETEIVDETVVDERNSQLERIDTQDEARRAAGALQQLAPDQRRVLELSVLGGLTHVQVADATGIPLGTVKSHIRRGLDKVRRMLLTSSAEPTKVTP